MRYTQQVGNEKMRMKVGMTFACMNMKKLARILWDRMENNGIFCTLLEILAFRRITYA